MRNSSIIIFGILSALVLIVACISLNAPRFYHELALSSNATLVSKPILVLRDRT